MLAAFDEPGRRGERKVHAVTLELADETGPRIGGIAEIESLDDGVGETATAQIRAGARSALLPEHSSEVCRRDSIRFIDRFAFAACACRAWVLRLELDPGFERERAHGIAKREILQFLREGNDVSAHSAAETLEETAIGMNVK